MGLEESFTLDSWSKSVTAANGNDCVVDDDGEELGVEKYPGWIAPAKEC
jgi:hypothetical protein